MHVKASANPVQNEDIRPTPPTEAPSILASTITGFTIGRKKGSKSYAAVAASAGPQATAADQGAPSGSDPPSTPPPRQTPAPTPGRGTPSTRTPAVRPDHSKSSNTFAAVAEADELPDGESTSEHGENDVSETEEEQEEGESLQDAPDHFQKSNGRQLALEGRRMGVGPPPRTRHGRNVAPEMGHPPSDGTVWGNSSGLPTGETPCVTLRYQV